MNEGEENSPAVNIYSPSGDSRISVEAVGMVKS